VIRAYAASVASSEEAPGRVPTALMLRVALLVDDKKWKLTLPGLENASNEHQALIGHSKHVSYVKCINDGLSVGTKISCRIGRHHDGRKIHANSSWFPGRLRRFQNAELRQDFAECELMAPNMRWIQQKVPPRKVLIEIRVRSRGALEAIVPVELCLVRKPMMRVSFCSQPLYGFHGMRAETPSVVEDWLEYHLEHLGIEHAEVYDVDGSFREAMEPWTRSSLLRGSTVTYHQNWPATLSPSLQQAAEGNPYCTELFAYAHCVTTHRALSRIPGTPWSSREGRAAPGTGRAGNS